MSVDPAVPRPPLALGDHLRRDVAQRDAHTRTANCEDALSDVAGATGDVEAVEGAVAARRTERRHEIVLP